MAHAVTQMALMMTGEPQGEPRPEVVAWWGQSTLFTVQAAQHCEGGTFILSSVLTWLAAISPTCGVRAVLWLPSR